MILKLKGIKKSYSGSEEVLKGININLRKGEIIGLIGESGSGKSTLLNIIAHKITSDHGSMYFQDEEIDILNESLMKETPGIRIMNQNSKVPENISVYEILSRQLFSYEDKWKERRIKHLIKICKLKDLEDKKSHELSGGQLQRVALALCVADSPEVILLDEAFTSMDFSLKNKIQMEWLDVLKKEEISSIMVTHDPKDALMFSDVIYIMRKGRIIQKGSPKTVYHHPKSRYAAELFGIVNTPEGNFRDEEGNMIFYRPEDFKINNKKGKHEVEVLNKYYRGLGFLYKVKLGDQKLTVFSKKDFEEKRLFVEWGKK